MISLPFLRKKQIKTKPLVLLVLDGFGLAPGSAGNAITLAKTPHYDSLVRDYPNTELIASGESVGLPANEVGNTEVGHLTLGAGRVILQDLKKINLAIEKGSFYDNRAFLQAASHVKKYSSKLHLLGLIGSGSVHSSMEHLYAALQFCKKEEINNVALHLFTDGRDAPPKEGVKIIEKLEKHLGVIKIGQIASICGRYYAMDRDRRWERTEKAYKAIVEGLGKQAASAVEAVNTSYGLGQTDEFVEPTIVTGKTGPLAVVNDNDAVIFFNYRIDRPKQLTMAFTIPNFETVKTFDFGYDPDSSQKIGEVEIGKTFNRSKVPKNLFFVTMTEYHKNLPVSGVGYPPEIVEKPLSQILSESGLKQLKMSESEKERFVTYYFNGLREAPFPGEEFEIVPSLKVATYDKKPEMSLPKLVGEFVKQISRDEFNFAVINFANADMVAHSGDLKATIRAIEYVDKYMGELTKAVMSQGGSVFITADHGNAEELISYPSTSFFYTSDAGTVNTDHSNNPVPLIIANALFKNKKVSLKKGALADVAPSILGFMGIKTPDVMTGKNLFVIDQSNTAQIAQSPN